MRTKYSKSVEAGKAVRVLRRRGNLGCLVENEGRMDRENACEVLTGLGSEVFSFYAMLTLNVRHQTRVPEAQGSERLGFQRWFLENCFPRGPRFLRVP